jgi:glycosidase
MKYISLLLILCAVTFSACSKKVQNDNTNTATPYFSPTTTQISASAGITIGCDDDADIYYTTDGTEPSQTSTPYTEAFKLTAGSWTVKARAYCSGKPASDIAIQDYTVINGTVKPVVSASPPAGHYVTGKTVTLSSSNSSSDTIYYTTNGTDPEIGADGTSVYSDSISVSTSMTIRAFAKTPEGVAGDVKLLTYSIDESVVPSPVISPAADEITDDTEVTIAASLGTITYTIDTSDFTSATSYTGAFKLTAGTRVVRAIATNGGVQSIVAMKSFVVTAVDDPVDPATKVETPVITVLGSAPYTTATSVQITSATTGATILYSIDGGSYQTYSAAFTLAAGYHHMLAKATKTGMSGSSVTSLSFDIVPAGTAVRIYYSGTSAPQIWIWEVSPDYSTSEKMGLAWATRPSMNAMSGLSGWYYYDIPATYRGTGTITLKFGDTQYTMSADKPWFKNGSWYSANPDVLLVPVITASPVAKTYKAAQSVTLAGSNTSDTIYYTTDGIDPTTSSSKYSSAISITATKTIKAFGVNADGISGDIASFAYIIDPTIDDTAPTIVPSVTAGSYTTAQTVKFTVTDDKSATTRAFYTTDSSAPTESSESYVSGNASAGLAGSSFTIKMDETKTFRFLVIDGAGNRTTGSFYYRVSVNTRDDFRKESIYFVMTTRFYDGDSSNNFNCWDESVLSNPASDPGWRGDFKGLVDKLDYIKALGFTAIWVTPPTKNMSGLDYHGYHSINFKKIDPRYKTSSDASADEAYQKFIDACHAKGIKVVQDIVLNHSSNFGEENFFPLFEKDADGGYIGSSSATALTPNDALNAAADRLAAQQGKTRAYIFANQPYQARLEALKTTAGDPNWYYHHGSNTDWNQWSEQDGDIAGDCRDLNTENAATAAYLEEAYDKWINMGVDAFRIDTTKHISRVTFNNYFIPHFKSTGGDNFYMFGECCNLYSSVWDNGIPVQSSPFYTWKDSKSYAWSFNASEYATNVQSTKDLWTDNSSTTGQPTSDNHYLSGNTYHTPDYSKRSGLGVIDFCMHHNFGNAGSAYSVKQYDNTYNDATWNVVYVDSHDYGPNNDGGMGVRFNGSEETLAENMTLMFTFRGIPTVYYGTEVQFQKGKQIEPWYNGNKTTFANSGRAYFGANLEGSVSASAFGSYDSASGTVKSTLDHPLAKHIARLNQMRRAIPALQRGQYSTDDVSASGTAAFKRRYTNTGENVDSFVLVTISGSATFSNIPSGTYTDAVTGATYTSSGSLTVSCSGQGNARILVLNSSIGKVGTAGTYLK